MQDLDRLLRHAERATALLERTQPANGPAEVERLVARWEAGEVAAPEFRYRPCPDLAPLVDALERAEAAAERGGPIEALYAGRARELAAEARIVAALGTPELCSLAAVRFPLDESAPGRLVTAEAERWAALVVPPAPGPFIPADDRSHPGSLVRMVLSLVGRLRLPFRVVVAADLASAAATGDGVIVVRSGVAHPEARARRIALHEVHGHAVPRVRAQAERLGLFAVGSPEGPDDEEGRALLVEQRHGLLDDARKRELGGRHVAAVAARRGAEFPDAVRALLGLGWTPREAMPVVARVYRGGGLARELVYLSAFARVRAALESDPGLERFMERGRIGVAAARTLARVESVAAE